MDVVVRTLQRSAAQGQQLAAQPTAVRMAHKKYSYNDVLLGSKQLLPAVDSAVRPAASEYGPRVACLANPGLNFVVSKWSTWMHGGIFVPLATSHPPNELEYTLADAEVSLVLVEREHLHKVEGAAKARGISVRVLEDEIELDALAEHSRQHGVEEEALAAARQRHSADGAFILYTSGTTGTRKGVLHTHRSVKAQMEALTTAWAWQSSDSILHGLPLHHIHGLVMALMCAHYNGACVDFLPSFSALSVWRKLEQGDVTTFMGVPTMYSHLLTVYGKMKEEEQARCREAAAALRLTVCGSAACPVPIIQAWQELSGQVLLERYGMSEGGVLLSNPLAGPRVPGAVGQPVPGVEVKVAAPADAEDAVNGGHAAGRSGELHVRGAPIFREYWRRPEATAAAFSADGFFVTGETVDMITVPGAAAPYFRILSRTSVDIIKSGGFKVSALHIESQLLQHPDIREVAVFGVPDAVYGEKVVCVAALQEGAAVMDTAALAAWAADHLPPYEIPRDLVTVDAIPRNAMGKVNKKQLRATTYQEGKAAVV